MRYRVLHGCVLGCALVGGCGDGGGPAAAGTALGTGSGTTSPPGVAIDRICRLPRPEEFALFRITRDEALELGKKAAELPSDSHMFYHVTPCMWRGGEGGEGGEGGRHVWHVSGSSAIAGGWEAWIDALGGGTWQMRRLPGR